MINPSSITIFGRISSRPAITMSSRVAQSIAARANSSSVPAATTGSVPVGAHDERGEVHPIDLISGAPSELSSKRVVRIYQRAKTAMQSGNQETKVWRLDWDVEQKGNRWENEMMGWQSSGDYMQATEVKFKTKEDAVRFATRQGWDYYIQLPHKRDFRPKQYATNFLHSYGPLKHIRTK
ncbi:ETC complex I subunit conserved region-domain-containing protein [Lipomyces oligophaga]|uniref:ETC complex I subunit conserved region-domain-containing protein n=1 Tax=Lipomyces oligophaga TaxID=45792 RepID=UPI0034CFA82B